MCCRTRSCSFLVIFFFWLSPLNASSCGSRVGENFCPMINSVFSAVNPLKHLRVAICFSCVTERVLIHLSSWKGRKSCLRKVEGLGGCKLIAHLALKGFQGDLKGPRLNPVSTPSTGSKRPSHFFGSTFGSRDTATTFTFRALSESKNLDVDQEQCSNLEPLCSSMMT